MNFLHFRYWQPKTALVSWLLSMIVSITIANSAMAQTSNQTIEQSATQSANICLSNDSPITLGASQKDVLQACGEPSDTDNSTKPITKQEEVEHWYYLTEFGSINSDAESNYSVIRIVVQFNSKTNKVTNIHLYRPSKTDIDKDDLDLLIYVIRPGDSKADVEQILGKPFTTKTLTKPVVVGQQDIATWQYTDADKTQQFTFIDDKLAAIQ